MQWMRATIEDGRTYDVVDMVSRINRFRRISRSTRELRGPIDALSGLEQDRTDFMQHFITPSPPLFKLLDESSLDIAVMWPLLIRGLQRYSGLKHVLRSESFVRPALVEPGHHKFNCVATDQSLNNPGYGARATDDGVVERFSLAFYNQFRFDLRNPIRRQQNIAMLDEMMCTGALEVVLDLMERHPDEENIQLFTSFFLASYFLYAESFSCLDLPYSSTSIMRVFTRNRNFMHNKTLYTAMFPRISSLVSDAVIRFPYMMKMRYLRALHYQLSPADLQRCGWQSFDSWYEVGDKGPVT